MIGQERPRIGVVGSLVERGGSWRVDLPVRYAQAVLRAGGVPVGVYQVGGPADRAALLDALDGLLVGGGDDFDTERLGLGPTHAAATPVPTAKQDFDLALVEAALERRLPVLGVCYGMQLLALAEGARLHQHLPEDLPGVRAHGGGGTPDARHGVTVRRGSKLEGVLGVARLDVISRHHQALCTVAAPWRVAAEDDEGVVEAVERDGAAFALGVQWHPELAPEGSAEDRLFRALVDAAGLFGARRRGAVGTIGTETGGVAR